VRKSECCSSNQSIVNNSRTTTMLTSVATTETLLLSEALGSIRCSYRKKGIVNSTYSATLSMFVLAMTAATRAAAPASWLR
jgi:hypothetical protein